jgi:hypothetical protein
VLAVAVTGVAGLVLGFYLWQRGYGAWHASERVHRTGNRTEGVVTRATFTGGTVNQMPIYKYTVRFTDQAGTERYIQRRLTVGFLGSPSEGDRTWVWYDPADAGNLRSIYVELFA